MDAVDQALTSEFHGNQRSNSHGLAIYFPRRESSFDSDYNSSIIDFPADTEWDEFLLWYYGTGGDEITLLAPDDGAALPASPPATFTWEADSNYRFKIQFSPTSSFVLGFPTLTVPNSSWMPDTTTDTIPAQVLGRIWNIIQKMEQINGIVYWKVIGKAGPSAPIEISEMRSFNIE